MKYKTLTKTDRNKLEAYLRAKSSPKFIAKELGCHISTVYREIKRGQYTHLNSDYTTESRYSSDKAQMKRDYLQTSKGASVKLGNDYAFVKYIAEKIKSGKSPAVALADIKRENRTFRTRISLRTLYAYIDSGLIVGVTNKNLYMKGKRKRKYRKTKAVKSAPRGMSIEKRPKDIASRDTFGHWELDSVIGTRKKGKTILTLIERKTRYAITFTAKNKSAAETVRFINTLERKYGRYFSRIFKTITVDNGTEFANTLGMQISPYTKRKRTAVYYCHPYSSYERGTNENYNRLLRRFIIKRTPIEHYTPDEINAAETFLNTYPRALLQWQTPLELFEGELSKIMQSPA